jgi:hypothetical protein
MVVRGQALLGNLKNSLASKESCLGKENMVLVVIKKELWVRQTVNRNWKFLFGRLGFFTI